MLTCNDNLVRNNFYVFTILAMIGIQSRFCFRTLNRRNCCRQMCNITHNARFPESNLPQKEDKAFDKQIAPITVKAIEYDRFKSVINLRKLCNRKLNIVNSPKYYNDEISLTGWVSNVFKKSFILSDGTGRLKCEISQINNCPSIQTNSLLTVQGVVDKNENILNVIRLQILSCSDELAKTNLMNSYTYRSHSCGELNIEHVGVHATLCGWLEYQRMSKFLLLRDCYGSTQCVLNKNVDTEHFKLETILKISGTVSKRPKDMVNWTMATGDIEIIVDHTEVLNSVCHVPFNIRKYHRPKEQLRMQHRYVDLRHVDMQNNLRLRSSFMHKLRKHLVEKHAFVEVETPTLFCETPGGAREFLVATKHPGQFYSLVQSPQQFKQMLMAGGIDRYFQIARCYRDETTRPDRQPEFTQLDIELSFADRENIMRLVEDLLYETLPVPITKPPFKSMTYLEALECYGTDKPDISFGMLLKNVSRDLISDSNSDAYAINYTDFGKFDSVLKSKIKQVSEKYKSSVILACDINKKFGEEKENYLKKMFQIDTDKALIVSVGQKSNASQCLGEVRLLLAQELKERNLLEIKSNFIEPLWIVDFPLFLRSDTESGDNKLSLETCHHPFTAPNPDDISLLEENPLSVRSLAYDLVMCGQEVAGGSVRVQDAELQKRLLHMLNIDEGKLKHLINALSSGCPPHAGVALGLDRIMALACQTQSIRDVIAFPKSHEGCDPLSGAPLPPSPAMLEYYHLQPKLTK